MTIFYYNFSTKRLSRNGKGFVFIFTGTADHDGCNRLLRNFVPRTD
jgi:hypothetical protein